MADEVAIVKLDAVGGLWMWLCAKHEKKREKKWGVLERRRPPGKIECDDCRAERGLTR